MLGLMLGLGLGLVKILFDFDVITEVLDWIGSYDLSWHLYVRLYVACSLHGLRPHRGVFI